MSIRTVKRHMTLPRTGRGFSLVELMVALAIGLFLVIGLISLLVSTSHSRTELDKTSRQIENGRYALQLLVTDVQHAGFLGHYMPKSDVTYSTTADPCGPAASDFVVIAGSPPAITVPVFLYGYDGSTTAPTCVTNRVANTAAIVIRRASTTTTTVGAAAAGETYIQVDACGPLAPPLVVSSNTGDFVLQTKDCATVSPLNKYVVRIYYVGSCNDCSGGGDGVPTLKVVEFLNGAMSQPRSVVEGIQNMQFDYGVDMNSDGAPDCYITNPTSPDASQISTTVCPNPTSYDWTNATRNWSNVVTVRVYVLARNTEPTADWSDTRTYDLGKAGSYTPPTGDKFKRHVYSAVARAVNISGRKEAP